MKFYFLICLSVILSLILVGQIQDTRTYFLNKTNPLVSIEDRNIKMKEFLKSDDATSFVNIQNNKTQNLTSYYLTLYKNLKRASLDKYSRTHTFIAKFDRLEYKRCLGKTALCPDLCGGSGMIAYFKIEKYISFTGEGLSGSEKLTEYSTQITGRRKPLDSKIAKKISELIAGDLVRMKIRFTYDTRKNVVEPINDILYIRKL